MSHHPRGSPRLSSWPTLTGSLFRELRGLLSTSSEGLLLSGGSGVGKSVLAGQLVDAARGRSVRIVCSPGDALVPLGAPGRLLGGNATLAQVREHLSQAIPTLVILDDAQWLDDTTAGLLADLSRAGIVRLVATARSQIGLAYPLHRLLHDDLLVQVAVAGMPPEDVLAVLEEYFRGPVDPRSARWLFEATQGNPLFVREAVRAGVAAGDFHEEAGVWTHPGWAMRTTRLELGELIDSELGRVPTEHREALDLIALSEPVALATVLEAAGEADWADSIEALATAGLVQVDSSDPAETIVRMGHLLYGAHARDRVPVSRRRELHAKRYAGVDPDGLTESEFDKWVRWSLEGGLSVTPAQLLRTAKSSATAGHDGVALSLAESAVAGFPEHSAERVEALLLCSVLHVHGGAAAQAKALIDTVIADLDDCVADDFTRMLLGAGAYRIRADLEQFAFDDPAAALATVDETIEALPGLSAFVDVRCVRARRLAWAGDTSGVAQLLPWIEVVSIPAPLEILEVVALGITELVSRGEVDRGLELSARYWGQAVDAHETMTWIGFELTAATLLAYVSAGRLKDLAAHEHLMPLMTQRHDEASARVGMGELLGRQGDWERAWHEISQAVQTLRWRDAAGLLTWALSAAADAAMMTGRAAEAAAFLAEVDQGLKGASRGMAATARLHSCRAAIGLGLADAPGRCAELASWAQEWGYDLVRLDALHLLGLASPEALRRHLAEAAPLPLPHPSAPVMAALSDHITAVLGGRKTSVANSLKLLSEMGRWTPVVRASPHLTKRERQIAIMVAAGDSSPAIAERLHLSVRTVETHVSRVMAKLGVSRRSDIAGVLAPESVVGAPPGHPPRTVFPPAR